MCQVDRVEVWPGSDVSQPALPRRVEHPSGGAPRRPAHRDHASRPITAQGHHVLLRERDAGGCDVLLEVQRGGGAWDRQRDRRAVQEPGESDLGGCGAMPGRYAAETAAPRPQVSTPERKPADEGYALLLAKREDVLVPAVGE